MGKWPWCCKSPCQGGFNELWSESAQWLLSSDIRKISGIPITPMATPMRPQWANDHDAARLYAKTVPMNLIWSESAQWLLSSSIYKVTRTLITPLGTPMWPWWANNHDAAHLQTEAVPMNLIWKESTQWFLSSCICKVSRLIITPMSTPMWPQWANDHDVARLEVKTVPMNLIWSESTRCLLSSSIQNVTIMLIMPLGKCIWPWWTNDHDFVHLEVKLVPMNLIWSESAPCLLRSSIRNIARVIIVHVATPMWPWWANDHDVAHLQIKMVPMNLIWRESTQWLLSSSVCKVSRVIIKPMSMPMWPQWANDHDIAHLQIKTVPKNLFWVNQPSCCDGRKDGQRLFHCPLYFPSEIISILLTDAEWCIHVSIN